MRKLLLAAASLCVLAIVPAVAQDKMAAMECTDADMTKMNTKIDSMATGDSKKMAMDHMKMAKDSMAAKDMKACAMHMQESMSAMDKGMMDKK